MSEPTLRVAFVLPTFPEPSNTFVLNQIIGLLDRGHDVALFAIRRKPFDNADADVLRYGLAARMQHVPVPPSRWRRTASAMKLLASPEGRRRASIDGLNPRRHGARAFGLVPFHTAVSLLRGGRFDVVHCQFGNLGPGIERFVRLAVPGSALVTSFRGADLTAGLARRPRQYADLLRRCDLFLPVSDDFRQRLIGFGAPPERVVVHRSGIDLRRFAFQPPAHPEGAVRLVFVGRLTEKKGVRYLLEAVGLTRASGVDVTLDVIGGGQLEPELIERSSALGLAGQIRFHGVQPHERVVEAMRRSHVLVAPSVTARDGDQEGIPNVLKEAMAMGLPVVATRHSGIPELVEHGVTGFLAAERDVEDLARCIAVVAGASARWPEFGRAGRSRIEREYDARRLNDELVALYRRVVGSKAERRG